ncbi:MAG TPA: rhodanese-like domain-containing protein [Nocardioides sp.]|nr:rhodanese-like domain-containing protein [Nocardioides sp.]
MFEPQIPVRDVTPAEAQALAEQGAVLVDVREPYEWSAGHVAGSVHAPLGRLAASAVPADRTVVLVCRSGNRSRVAAELLLASGHRDVVNLAGGLVAWDAAGLPLVTADASSRTA